MPGSNVETIKMAPAATPELNPISLELDEI
jgi:hypothetical protein